MIRCRGGSRGLIAIANNVEPKAAFASWMLAGGFVILSAFYGAVWSLCLSVTPGMRWTNLRLSNFDGFPPEGPQRALRYFATCLSFATCGLGLLWALVDEGDFEEKAVKKLVAGDYSTTDRMKDEDKKRGERIGTQTAALDRLRAISAGNS